MKKIILARQEDANIYNAILIEAQQLGLTMETAPNSKSKVEAKHIQGNKFSVVLLTRLACHLAVLCNTNRAKDCL